MLYPLPISRNSITILLVHFPSCHLPSGFPIKMQCVYLFRRNATCFTQLSKFISLYYSYHQITWIILSTRKLKRNLPDSRRPVNVNRHLPLPFLLQMWQIHLFTIICIAARETILSYAGANMHRETVCFSVYSNIYIICHKFFIQKGSPLNASHQSQWQLLRSQRHTANPHDACSLTWTKNFEHVSWIIFHYCAVISQAVVQHFTSHNAHIYVSSLFLSNVAGGFVMACLQIGLNVEFTDRPQWRCTHLFCGNALFCGRKKSSAEVSIDY
jgi:hypothetical protein